MPPDSLTTLQALALDIARGKAGISLGPKAKLTLDRILALIGQPELLSITALAGALQVHPSTLTRLAHSLGYSGFPAFQKVLVSASMAAPGDFYSRQAQAALRQGSTTRARAAQLCAENQANIDRFLAGLDETAFDTAAALICSAPRVAVYGIRQFHALASFLAYGLQMIRPDVALLQDSVAEGLAAILPDGVLVVASCAPYSRQVVETAMAACQLGLPVVAITDRAGSPLCDASQAAILVPHGSSFLSNSLGAFTVAAECLINACAARNPDQTRAALQDRDRLITLLGIETGQTLPYST